jgi:Protein of unknown function (DUF2971)
VSLDPTTTDDPEDRLPQVLQELLKTCDADIQAALKPFSESIEAEPPPNLIYHYTDGSGLIGIIRYGTLWLTDIFSLNDPSELKHGIDIASSLINSIKSDDDVVRFFAERFVKIVNEGIENIANFFVCSFSTDGSDLSQWRSYADDGRGYVLGFDTQALEQAFGKTTAASLWACSTFSITYDDGQLADIQEKMINVVLPHLRNVKRMGLDAETSSLFHRGLTLRLALGCVNASVFFKHPAYTSEREYRFLQLHRYDDELKAVKFRQRPYQLVRYMEYAWKDVACDALKCVVAGPASDPVMAKQYAIDCLKSFMPDKFDQIRIDRSKIPYRGR